MWQSDVRQIVQAIMYVGGTRSICTDVEGVVPRELDSSSFIPDRITAMSIERTRLLCSACKSGCLDLVEGLLKLGCRPGVRYKSGKTLVHYASTGGCIEIVKYLVAKGCDPRIQDESEQTPLHLASLHGHAGIVRYLVDELDCDWRAIDTQGRTSLHCAVEHGHVNIGLFLVNHDTGSSTLQVALQEGNVDLVKFIYETPSHCTEIYFMMKAACFSIHNCSDSGCEEIIRYFINVQHLHPECKDENELTLSTSCQPKRILGYCSISC